MKLFFLLIGTILAFGLLFGNQSFAIDYRDSTGYTPSWALGKGYHSVLLECTEISSTTSRDGNWCMEWVAYVLDQGIENFPESTAEVPSKSKPNPLSERLCSPNKLCAFPGEYLRYKNSDTWDGFSEIAIVDFKEKINDDNIRVFIDGWGSKPLTYTLNLKTGIETHSEYTGVNRPFNLLEPIPMKIGQQVSQSIENYYDATIEDETTTNLKNFGLMDMERTIMGARTEYENGDSVIYAYDKETGVLITQIEKYTYDGKQYTSGILLTDTNIFSAPTKITNKQISADTSTSDQFSELRSIFDGLSDEYISLISEDISTYTDGRKSITRTYKDSLNDHQSVISITIYQHPSLVNENDYFLNAIDQVREYRNQNPSVKVYDDFFNSKGWLGEIRPDQSDPRNTYPINCFVTFTTIDDEDQFSQSTFCVKGKFSILEIVVDDEYFVDSYSIPLIHSISSIDKKYNYPYNDWSNLLVDVKDPIVTISGSNKFKPSESNGFITQSERELETSPTSVENNTPEFLVISDKESCLLLGNVANWDPNLESCYVSSLTINSGETLTISKGVNLDNTVGLLKNMGTINVEGEIINFETIENYGTINLALSIVNKGKIVNKGSININKEGALYNWEDGTLDNYGSLSNNNNLVNHGKINNHCNGEIIGNPVGAQGFGIIPIKNIPCKEETSQPKTEQNSEGGGCLIATATYGSELAPKVQQLRELRDNKLLQTGYGSAFMESFNVFYYSFSPVIANFERENPLFRETVKLAITPMISSLSILNHVDMDSEVKVLGYGISLILLNVGMYIGVPVTIIFGIKNFRNIL